MGLGLCRGDQGWVRAEEEIPDCRAPGGKLGLPCPAAILTQKNGNILIGAPFRAPQPRRADYSPAAPLCRGAFFARLRQPQDHVAVALARAAKGAKPVDIPRIKPNEIIAVGRAILLNANA